MRKDQPNPPGGVPATAARPGETYARWAWAERAVWTERMLDALERGVQGGRWHSLSDKVWRPENLAVAWEQVRKNKGAPGADRVTLGGYERQKERNLADLHTSLRDGTYRPGTILRKHIPKPGRPGQTRPLGIPGVRDRIVQTALRNVLEPIFERTFAEHSYGFRPKRGAKDALRRVQALIGIGYTHVVDADLKAYFDTIPHESLMAAVSEQVADRTVLALVRSFLRQPVLDGDATVVPEVGTPQGAVISPLLANIYLTPLDHLMAREGFEMVRYADDFVILCRTAEEARRALDVVRTWTASAGLTLHPEKTRLVDLNFGGYFDFLGYRFRRQDCEVTPKNKDRLRDRVRELTPRNSGIATGTIVAKLNAVLRGWHEYFKHGHKAAFVRLDQFVRQRLRAVLWRRQKRKGMPSAHANHMWPNAFFAKLGLVSLVEARALAVQSVRAANLRPESRVREIRPHGSEGGEAG